MPPEISVIVPAHNAAATIGRTLSALAGQSDAPEFEVIVVDDGSGDETAALAEGAGARVVRHRRPRGSAAARNSGVAAAEAPLLAFTDSDCEPVPQWLARGVAALAEADLVQGAVLPDPSVEAGTFDRTIVVARETGRYETANLFVRRSCFDAAGGFRSFIAGDLPTVPGLKPVLGEADIGEDAMLGWRVRRAGGRAAFSSGALVHHAVFQRDAVGYVSEHWRLRYFPTLVAAVPELRGGMIGGVFLSGRRMAFDVAAAGVLAAAVTRRPWPLVAALPYVWRHTPARHLPRRRAAVETAAFAAADALGLAGLLYGCATARELVL